MDQTWCIERLAAEKSVQTDYYDAAAAMNRPRRFPSPVNDPDWLEQASSWFVEGRVCLEIGPGRGEFARAAIRRQGLMQRYYIVDMSRVMLDKVMSSLGDCGGVELNPICSDIDQDPLPAIPDQSVDRAIMINVFQDLQPLKALRHLRRIISPDGLLRANMSDREVRDTLRIDDEFFDRETGSFYMTRPPLEERQQDVSPLGFVNMNGNKVPFYRILKSYYRDQLHEIFQKCGFEIIRETPMILSKKVWMDSVEGRHKDHINEKKRELIEKFGGYPGKLDVIARPV